MRAIDNRTEDMVLNAVNAVLGAVLLLTPWYLGLASETAAARNAWFCGAAITLIAVLALGKSYDWEEYLNLALGLWVAVAPWMLGFVDIGHAMAIHLAVGLAVAAFAGFELWRLYQAPEVHSV